MNSKRSETLPPSKGSIEDVISGHGESISPSPQSPEIAAQLDRVELLIEELGKRNELVGNFADYVTELKKDVVALRRTRFWLLLLTIVFIVGTDATVLYVVINHSKWFSQQDIYFKSVVFVGTLTASVVLLSIMLKGAFHSLAERNKEDDGLPPHIKAAMDALKLLVGK